MAENNFLTDFSDSSSFSDFLETQPQALYQSYLGDPKNNMNASMKRYYQNQFSNIQNEYIGSLARDMRGGELPKGRFSDYLESNLQAMTDIEKKVPISAISTDRGLQALMLLLLALAG